MNHLINLRLSKRQQMPWSMSGVHYLLLARDEILDGRLVEHFNRKSVADALDRVALMRALPAAVTVDNGTEFTSKVLEEWA